MVELNNKVIEQNLIGLILYGTNIEDKYNITNCKTIEEAAGFKIDFASLFVIEISSLEKVYFISLF